MLSTYNRFIDRITDYFSTPHLQIQRFEEGMYDDMATFITEDTNWPIMWLVPISVTHTQFSISNYNVRVYFLDRLEKDDSNERDVLSDQLSISRDFTNWLRLNEDNGFNLLSLPTAVPVKSVAMDYTAGWYIDMEIEVETESSDCTIPFAGIGPVPPAGCDPVTVNINGDFIGSPASGSTYQITIENTAAGAVGTITLTGNSTGTVQIADVNVVNSNDTYDVDVVAEGSLVLPDTNIQSTSSNFTDTVPSADPAGYTIADVNWTDSDTTPQTTEYGQPIVCTPCALASLSIEVYSDAGLTNPITTANFDDTIYIKLVVTNITPTSYRFYVSADGADGVELFEQAGHTLAYNVFGLQDVVIYAEATDGSSIAAAVTSTTITVTDTNADAFIAAHNTLSSLSMGSVQQKCVQDTYRMLKGSNTPNGNDLFAYHTANANTRFFPLIPVDDSTFSIAGYTLDIFHLATGSYSGFVIGNFSVNGVTGGNTKYFNSGVSPSSLPIDNISCAIYSRTNFSGFDADFGAADVANSLNNSVRCETNNNFGMRFSLNDSTSSSVSVIDSLGLRLLNRVGTIKKGFDLDELTGQAVSVATTSSPTATTYFHFINGYTTVFYYSRRQLCLYWQALGMNTSQIEDWKFIMNHIQKTVITGGRDV